MKEMEMGEDISLALKYMAPPRFVVERIRNRMHAMLVVGAQGSGKTTWTLSKIAQAIELLLERGVDEREIAVVHAMEAPLSKIVLETHRNIELGRVRYLYLFNDDAAAAEGQHGRRALSRANVSESQFYAVIRHRLEDLGFNGFIFVAHATQVYNLIDSHFRKTAKLKVFTDYPEDPQDLKLIGQMLGRKFLLALYNIALMKWCPRDEKELVEAMELAVVKFMRIKDIVQAEYREIPRSVQYVPIKWKRGVGNIADDKGKPPIRFREFAQILRESGIRARNEKILEAWHSLLDKLGYPVTVEDLENANT